MNDLVFLQKYIPTADYVNYIWAEREKAYAQVRSSSGWPFRRGEETVYVKPVKKAKS
jgi:hypothetical protein